jgi:HlyD family secretion protein
MKRLLLVLPVLALALVWWMYRRSSAAPEVPFTKVKRETLVSNLVTNGKVEPLEWVEVRAEQGGIVEKVLIEAGQPVARGVALAQLDADTARTELTAAEARVMQARAELEVLQRGGRSAELAEIDSALSRARLDAEVAGKDVESLRRLVEKQAATRQDLDQAAQRLERAKAEIESLVRKRAALVSDTDRAAAEARIREAEASVELARRRIANSLIRSPIAGIVYEKNVRLGAYLNPGDSVAKVGQIDKVRVRVYVDEPELGRVAQGLPVTITWDALQGRKWTGVVERMPTGVIALGTRQVGEVICIIENPNRDLLPGTNINAEIRSRVVENALTVPREALRRRSEQPGVFVLQGDKIVWRNVTLGPSSITRAQVLSGLGEGDAVALPSDTPLKDGMAVQPVYR